MTNQTHSHSGSALVAVVLWTTILLMLVGVMFAFTSLTYTQARRETRAAQAVNLGNAGLNHGIAMLRQAATYQGEVVQKASGEIDILVSQEDNEYVVTAQSFVPDRKTFGYVCRAFRVAVNPTDLEIVSKTYAELPQCETLTIGGGNQAPTISISEPNGTNDTFVSGGLVRPTITLNDADNVVTAALYYDTNNSGYNGVPLSGECSIVPEGTNVSCDWQASITPGTYYIYGEASDGVNTVARAYSPGAFTITAGTVSFSVVAPPQGQDPTIPRNGAYTLRSHGGGGNQKVTYYTDTDGVGYNGTQLNQCANLSRDGANTTSCTWQTASMPLGTYYIYAIASGDIGINQAQAYGTQPIVIAPECADHLDNDGNGLTDFSGADPNCSNATDDYEGTNISIDHINAIARDSQNNVYAVGSRQYNARYTEMIIRKTKPDGTVDTSFGVNGFVRYTGRKYAGNGSYGTYVPADAKGLAIAVGPDDKLYVAGETTDTLLYFEDGYHTQQVTYGWFVRKYSSSGVLDTTFGYKASNAIDSPSHGMILPLEPYGGRPTSLVISPSNDVYISGESDFFTSSTGGLFNPDVPSTTRQHLAVVKVTSNGIPYDGTHASPAWGNLITSTGNASRGLFLYNAGAAYQTGDIKLDGNNQPIIVSSANPVNVTQTGNALVMLKLTTNGTLDSGFGTSGAVKYSPPSWDQASGVYGLSIQGTAAYVAFTANKQNDYISYSFLRKYSTTNGQPFDGVGASPAWGDAGTPGMINLNNGPGGIIQGKFSIHAASSNRLMVSTSFGYYAYESNGAINAGETYTQNNGRDAGLNLMVSKAGANTYGGFIYAGEVFGTVPGSPGGTPNSLNWMTVTTISNSPVRAYYDSNIHN